MSAADIEAAGIYTSEETRIRGFNHSYAAPDF
jgi:hypothetical protein